MHDLGQIKALASAVLEETQRPKRERSPEELAKMANGLLTEGRVFCTLLVHAKSCAHVPHIYI